MSKLALWNEFCLAHQILERSVPLFETVNGVISVQGYGQNQRPLLRRSNQMDALVIKETTKILDDFKSGRREYDGLIYVMFWPHNDHVLPLYIGKSEKFGRRGGNLSANIADIANNLGKFARGMAMPTILAILAQSLFPGILQRQSPRNTRSGPIGLSWHGRATPRVFDVRLVSGARRGNMTTWGSGRSTGRRR